MYHKHERPLKKRNISTVIPPLILNHFEIVTGWVHRFSANRYQIIRRSSSTRSQSSLYACAYAWKWKCLIILQQHGRPTSVGAHVSAIIGSQKWVYHQVFIFTIIFLFLPLVNHPNQQLNIDIVHRLCAASTCAFYVPDASSHRWRLIVHDGATAAQLNDRNLAFDTTSPSSYHPFPPGSFSPSSSYTLFLSPSPTLPSLPANTKHAPADRTRHTAVRAKWSFR